MKYLIPYLKKYKKESILAPLFKMLEACFDLIVPLIVADLIDVGIAGRDTHYILTHFGLLLVMALLGLTCSFTAQYFAARAATGTSAGLRHELLDKIQSLSLTEFDQTGAATLITRMTSDESGAEWTEYDAASVYEESIHCIRRDDHGIYDQCEDGIAVCCSDCGTVYYRVWCNEADGSVI